LHRTRTLLVATLLVVLGACTSQAARDAEIAAQEAEILAQQQEAALVEEQLARRLAAEEEIRRNAAEAERARQQAERERLVAQARAREDAERRQREEEERLERLRLEELARVAAEREEKLERIAELEQQIAAINATATRDETSNEIMLEAIAVAEQLLDVLTEEQVKYEDTDADGNTVQPLSKELIAELENIKNDLVRQVNSQQ
tara:strand:- start:258 stop:869 length:612 start_codon:yes stop_codon:yes gene_type:complete